MPKKFKKDYALIVVGGFICLYCFLNILNVITTHITKQSTGLNLKTYLVTVILTVLNLAGFGLFHKGLRKDWL